jgi:hypothetical protein
MNSNLLDQLDFRRGGLNLLGLKYHGFALSRAIEGGVYYNKYRVLRAN